MIKLKRTINVGLLLLLMMQSGGLYIALKIQQYSAKVVMQHTISHNEAPAIHMTLSLSDYMKSLVEKNEIFYRGKMYDIKTRIFSVDSIDMMVIHDVKEGNILKKVKKLFAHNNDLQKTFPEVITYLLSLNYIRTNINNPSVVFTSIFIIKSDFSEKAIFRNSNVLTPPPEVI
jgi:hypothetical protein